jgi:hypothetical protein
VADKPNEQGAKQHGQIGSEHACTQIGSDQISLHSTQYNTHVTDMWVQIPAGLVVGGTQGTPV